MGLLVEPVDVIFTGVLLEPLCTKSGRRMAGEIWPRDVWTKSFRCAWRSRDSCGTDYRARRFYVPSPPRFKSEVLANIELITEKGSSTSLLSTLSVWVRHGSGSFTSWSFWSWMSTLYAGNLFLLTWRNLKISNTFILSIVKKKKKMYIFHLTVNNINETRLHTHFLQWQF